MLGKQYILVLFGVLFYALVPSEAFAQDVNDIAKNVVASTATLPWLISALAYLSGLLIGVTAIFKTIEHTNNPSQVPIRVPVIRFLVGGALFSLPIIIEATLFAINGGSTANFDPMTTFSIFGASQLIGLVTGYLSLGNVNSILNSIMRSMGEIPGMVTSVAYLLGLVMVVSAIYKTRDHVENPDQVPIKDVVIRFLTAGALFGLPTIFNAMFETINDSGMGLAGILTSIISGAGFLYSAQASEIACTGLEFTGMSVSSVTNAVSAGSSAASSGAGVSGVASAAAGALAADSNIGTVLCTIMQTTAGLPGFLAALSYILGTILGFWAVIKIRDHVNNPGQTPLHEGITRLIAGGAFFALPVVAVAIQYSVTPNVSAVVASVNANTGFANGSVTCGSSNGLDIAMACFMQNVLGPGHVLLNFFGFVAGLIFVMIGISRLTKSAQEGARGPGGIGTITTFVVAGFLMSLSPILKAVSGSMFANTLSLGATATTANLTYAAGMSSAETAAAYNVINAVLKFMIIIGMISFVRGIFIMRDVAEGSGQASTMAGMTHIIGGALAVNLGPLLNAVQSTLGITAFGVAFS